MNGDCSAPMVRLQSPLVFAALKSGLRLLLSLPDHMVQFTEYTDRAVCRHAVRLLIDRNFMEIHRKTA